MSIHHKHHKQSNNFSKRRRTRAVLICGLLVLTLVTCGFSLIRFISLDALNIQTINITGGDPSMVLKLQAAVFQSLEGNILGLFPRSSVFLYPQKAIVNDIKLMDPGVNLVKFNNALGTTLQVSITEKDPAAIVCSEYPDFSGTDIQEGNDASCYYADSNGLIFKKAPTITGNTYHRYYIPTLLSSESSTTNMIGMYATSTAEFNLLQKFYTDVVNGGIVADGILIKDNGEYELYIENVVKNIAPESYDANANTRVAVVYFNNARAFNESLANLLSFWSTMKNSPKIKSASTNFDYIDVRYGANVFYK